MGSRRSALSVPGSSERMLLKGVGLEADEVIIDLEDSVDPEAKNEARQIVAAFLEAHASDGPMIAVRINGLATPWGEQDVVELARQVGPRIGSLIVPKVERAEELLAVEFLLDEIGPPAAGIRLQALIETAAGLLRVGEIAAATGRLDALILGYLDLSASLGRATGLTVPAEWVHAQETVLVAARAYGRQAIDGPYLELRDDAGLQAWAEHVCRLGFDGKWAIHPAQLAAINAAFTPAPEEVARARAVLDALAGAEGRGAVELEGAMIDEASRKHALEVMARAEAAGVPS